MMSGLEGGRERYVMRLAQDVRTPSVKTFTKPVRPGGLQHTKISVGTFQNSNRIVYDDINHANFSMMRPAPVKPGGRSVIR